MIDPMDQVSELAKEPMVERLKGVPSLVVDDDSDILAIVKQALEAEGAVVTCCSDGNTAVHLCEQHKPRLVVLDMMLPKRSGFLVLEHVKTLKERPVVIMITGNEGKRHQAYAETLGVDFYMHKPIRLEQLVTKAQQLLGMGGKGGK